MSDMNNFADKKKKTKMLFSQCEKLGKQKIGKMEKNHYFDT